MGWSIWGTGKNLTLSLEDNGAVGIDGHGDHRCYPSTNNAFEILSRVEGANECLWSIHSAQASEARCDGFGRGLWRRFQDDGTKPLSMIEFHPADSREKACLRVSMMLPGPTFEKALDLFKLALGRHDVGYHISLGFIGLRVPEARTETPTVEEFFHGDSLKRKPYFTDEVALSIVPVPAETTVPAKR